MKLVGTGEIGESCCQESISAWRGSWRHFMAEGKTFFPIKTIEGLIILILRKPHSPRL